MRYKLRTHFKILIYSFVLALILSVQFVVIELFDCRMVGLRTGESLEPLVHSKLGESAKQASKAVEDFGVSVENLLMKHGKRFFGPFPSILIRDIPLKNEGGGRPPPSGEDPPPPRLFFFLWVKKNWEFLQI